MSEWSEWRVYEYTVKKDGREYKYQRLQRERRVPGRKTPQTETVHLPVGRKRAGVLAGLGLGLFGHKDEYDMARDSLLNRVKGIAPEEPFDFHRVHAAVMNSIEVNKQWKDELDRQGLPVIAENEERLKYGRGEYAVGREIHAKNSEPPAKAEGEAKSSFLEVGGNGESTVAETTATGSQSASGPSETTEPTTEGD